MEDVALRQRAARALSTADAEQLTKLWADWPEPPSAEYLRGPESGHVMVQGRIGGGGDRFNLGEATVVRATVLLRGGGLTEESVGTAYVMGGDREHVALAAVFDALLGDESQRQLVIDRVIEPLEREQAERDAVSRSEARSTVVDFLTVSREHL